MAQQKRTLLQTVTLVSLVFLGIYLIWCTVVWNRKPTILVDYVQKWNSTALQVPETDAAYPLYLDAAIALQADYNPAALEENWDVILPNWPYQPRWEIYLDWLHRHSATLDLIHEAANKPGFGAIVGEGRTEKEKVLWGDEDDGEWGTDEPPDIQQFDKLMDGSLLNVTMNYLGMLRRIAVLLKVDAYQAAFEGDASRFLSDIEAILNIARHVKEGGKNLPELVAASIGAMAQAVTGEVLVLSPEIFDDEHLRRLADIHRASDDVFHFTVESDRLLFLDILQRLYTDDGTGDGSCIVQNLPLMRSITSVTMGTIPSIHPVLAFLSGPIVSWHVASRQESLAEYDRQLDYYHKQSQLPLYDREFDDKDSTKDGNAWTRSRFIFVEVFSNFSDHQSNITTHRRTLRDSILAVIAMELYRRKEGQWPTQLDQAMEEPPIDPWSGEPLKIFFEDGRPLIYSVGVDRNDDSGAFCKIGRGGRDISLEEIRSPWMAYLEPERLLSDYEGYSADEPNKLAITWRPRDSKVIPDGDWILWPPIVD